MTLINYLPDWLINILAYTACLGPFMFGIALIWLLEHIGEDKPDEET